MPERTCTQSLWKLLAMNLFKSWKKCLDCIRSCRWNESGARGRKTKGSRENVFYLTIFVEEPMSLPQTFKQSILAALRKARKTLVHKVLIASLIHLVQRKTELTESSKMFRGLFEVIVSLQCVTLQAKQSLVGFHEGPSHVTLASVFCYTNSFNVISDTGEFSF